MNNRRKRISWVILILSAIIIKIVSFSAGFIERYYSEGVYPWIAKALRLLLGWLPFSVGDIFYLAAGVYLLRGLVLFIKKVFRKELNGQYLIKIARKGVFIWLVIYISFNILWGLNYNRLPMSQQFGLKMETYSNEELGDVVLLLRDSLNAIDAAGVRDTALLRKKRTLFGEACHTYVEVQDAWPLLHYSVRSVKPSLYGYAGNYMGFSGYYNPFSGEAQVNTTVPAFVQPFVTCHEIGHQLGYAKEDEANFAGFMAARSSSSNIFRYSAYFDMYSYARRELYVRDSVSMLALHEGLRPGIKNDFLTIRRFYQQYRNPLEPVIRKLYAGYLKVNQQPKGIMSYDEVVAMLVAYYKKTGKL